MYFRALLGAIHVSPALWLIGAIAASAWPLLGVLHPVGVTTATDGLAAALAQTAFLASLAGAALGMRRVERMRSLTRVLSAERRVLLEVVGTAAPAIVLVLATLVGPLLLAPQALGTEPAASVLAAALTALHAAALGGLLLQLPLQPGSRSILLPLLAWLLPAALTATAWGSRIASPFLVSRPTSTIGMEGAPWAALAWAPAPILALLAAAVLVAVELGPPHEIRHPG